MQGEILIHLTLMLFNTKIGWVIIVNSVFSYPSLEELTIDSINLSVSHCPKQCTGLKTKNTLKSFFESRNKNLESSVCLPYFTFLQ